MFKAYEFINPDYHCPLCNRIYKTYEEATKCIEKHGIPESIVYYDKMSSQFNCPFSICVKLKDNREVKYVFSEIIKGGEDNDIA